MGVGPRTKENVKKLGSSGKLTVPTLALNTVDTGNWITPKNLYQFGLSPLDEARQAAERAWQDGHAKIITIYPQGNWGKSVDSTFENKWQSLGGTIVSSLAYPTNGNLRDSIEQLMDVNQSVSRSKRLSKILGEKVKSVPRRRGDVDAIFLVATPNIARQIRPLLKFYFAGNIPVYSTSAVYSGHPSPRKDRDLDGIRFDDMPFVLADTAKMRTARQGAAKLWPNSYRRYPKLYAMGVDAYTIVSQLNRLSALPQFGIAGLTGTLYMDSNHVIHRQLLWAQFRGGVPRLLSAR